MLLYHTTPAVNYESICQYGLLLSKARATRPLIWLHVPSRIGWARRHVAKRHHVGVPFLASFIVNVPRYWLRRIKPGLYSCDSNIPREHLQGYVNHPIVN